MAVFNTFQIDAGTPAHAPILTIYTPDELAEAVNLFTGPWAPILSIYGDFSDAEEADYQVYFPFDVFKVHGGVLVPAEHPSPKFTMRAFKSTPAGYVYWEVDTPDLTGQFSGHNPALLSDIVIYHECCTRNDDFADI